MCKTTFHESNRGLCSIALGIAIALCVSRAQAQPLGDWYGTMSNFGGPRQASIIGGALSISPATAHYESPIAVFGDVRTMGFYPTTTGAQYDLAGTALGPTYTHPANLQSTFDGTTDGTWNYTVEVKTGNVYQLDRDWQNPTFMFNVGPSSQGGIAYDCATNSLWVANEGSCFGAGTFGITGSVTNYTMNGSPLSSTIFGSSGLLNDLAMDIDGTFWADGGNALFHYDSLGNSLGAYPVNWGGDSIRGAEIACIVPEPNSLSCLGLISMGCIWRNRYRKLG